MQKVLRVGNKGVLLGSAPKEEISTLQFLTVYGREGYLFGSRQYELVAITCAGWQMEAMQHRLEKEGAGCLIGKIAKEYFVLIERSAALEVFSALYGASDRKRNPGPFRISVRNASVVEILPLVKTAYSKRGRAGKA